MTEAVGMKKFVIWNLYINIALLIIVVGYGAFQYLVGDALGEWYWKVLLGLVVLTGPPINYLISASRSKKT